MSLRIRQIKGDWWLDKELQTGLTADQREFYIGLWQLADDAGYLDWDTVRIGAALYPFRAAARREKQIESWAIVLASLSKDAPHLVILPCGHARVPKMPGHQRLAGETRQVRTIERAHLNICRLPRVPAEPRESPRIPELERNGIGTVEGERKGTVVTRASANEETTGSEFRARVPRPTTHDILAKANAKGGG